MQGFWNSEAGGDYCSPRNRGAGGGRESDDFVCVLSEQSA